MSNNPQIILKLEEWVFRSTGPKGHGPIAMARHMSVGLNFCSNGILSLSFHWIFLKLFSREYLK